MTINTKEYRLWKIRNGIPVFKGVAGHGTLDNALLLITSIILAGIMIFICYSCEEVFAGEIEYNNEQIASAIYLAEGGVSAKKPFGILSVKCEGYEDCKAICLNTIRNNRKRYAEWGHKTHPTFLAFLASRYAPTNASNDPLGLNSNWSRNVLYFLEKNK